MACTVECLYVPHRRVRMSVSAGHSWHALVLAHVMATPAACEDPLNRTVNRELLYTSDDEPSHNEISIKHLNILHAAIREGTSGCWTAQDLQYLAQRRKA